MPYYLGCLIVLILVLGFIIWLQGRDKKALQEECARRLQFTKLWLDHGLYTRLYIISYLDDKDDVDVVAARLMRNQDDIGAMVDSMSPGNGAPLAQLLKDHIGGAVKILKGLKADNTAKQDVDDWFKNADDITRQIMQINPNICPIMVRRMMQMHLKMTIDEAIAHKQKKYSDELKIFDAIMNELGAMANFIYA